MNYENLMSLMSCMKLAVLSVVTMIASGTAAIFDYISEEIAVINLLVGLPFLIAGTRKKMAEAKKTNLEAELMRMKIKEKIQRADNGITDKRIDD